MLRFRRSIRLVGYTAISGVLLLMFSIHLLNSYDSNQRVIVSKTVIANHIAAQKAWAASVLGQDEQSDTSVQYCQVIPSSTGVGRLHINTQFLPWTTIEGNNLMLEPGGRYKPPNCRARSRVAIVIPYRDREKHLNIFLQYMHPFLQRQQLDYGIFVVEQVTGQQFNRGMLKNIGFVEAMKSYDYQCVIFNDVDLLPENDLIFYTCPSMPRHLSVAVDTLGYQLPYEGLLGGVVAMSKDHFTKINGYSNLYFEWGAEDDDLGKRVIYNNLTVDRFAPGIARFNMTKHARDTKSRSLKRSHRVGKQRGNEKPRDVIVKLATYRVRNKLYRARVSEKDNGYRGVFINEDLTRIRSNLLFQARQLVRPNKVLSVWMSDGTILLKDLSTNVIRINSESDLIQY